jgi:hypothetical protein
MTTLLRWLGPMWLLFAWHANVAAQPVAPPPCDAKDLVCMRHALEGHPARKLATWKEVFARPLVERIEPAPPVLAEYINWDNAAQGFAERPRPTQAPAAFVNEVKAAIADLPQEVNLLFVDRLVGIFLVDDLGGTGYGDVVTDEAGQAVAAFIVLDAGVLQRFTANEWATWKESSPFQPDPQWQLEARIERTAQDNRRNAIQYILLHELGHVLSIGSGVHPPWTVPPKDAGAPEDFTFSKLSWRLDGDRYASVFDKDFTLRGDVVYYFGAKLPAARMDDTYAQLAKTNFPSLYAATRPGDDFAEAFASYVHVVLMNRPWEITIRHGGEAVRTFKACWDEPRCAAKRQVLEAMLKSP